MKRTIFKPIMMLATMLVMLFASYSCEDMFSNPLKDKETGEDIPLLLIDINFFKTSYTVNLIDETTNEIFETSARIWVSGPDSAYVVNFAGERDAFFTTKVGSVELTTDPNRTPSEANPINLTFWADQIGTYGTSAESEYEAQAIEVEYASDGQKTINIIVSKIPTETDDLSDGEEDVDLEGEFDEEGGFVFGMDFSGLKSACEDESEYKLTAGLSIDDILKLKNSKTGELIFKSKAELYQYVADMKAEDKSLIKMTRRESIPTTTTAAITVDNQKLLRRDLLKFRIKSITLYGDSVKASLNGAVINMAMTWNDVENIPNFYGFRNTRYYLGQTCSISNFTTYYYVFAANAVSICSLGANISFESTATDVNFSFDAEFYNAKGKQMGGSSFVGAFNQSFRLENVTSEEATIKFKKNYFAFNPIEDITVNSLCSGDIKVAVTPASGYEVYDITFVAYCPDNSTVGLSPSYSAQYKPINSGSTVAWQGVKMEGGHFRILAKPDTEYQIKLTFDGKTEYVDITTNMQELENKIDTEVTSIKDNGTSNGVHYLKVTHKFVDDCPFSI